MLTSHRPDRAGNFLSAGPCPTPLPRFHHYAEAAYTLGMQALTNYVGGAITDQLNGLVSMGFDAVNHVMQAVGQSWADGADAAGIPGGAFLAERAESLAEKGTDKLQESAKDGVKDFSSNVVDQANKALGAEIHQPALQFNPENVNFGLFQADRGTMQQVVDVMGQVPGLGMVAQAGQGFLDVDKYAQQLAMNESVNGDEHSWDFWGEKNQAIAEMFGTSPQQMQQGGEGNSQSVEAIPSDILDKIERSPESEQALQDIQDFHQQIINEMAEKAQQDQQGTTQQQEQETTRQNQEQEEQKQQQEQEEQQQQQHPLTPMDEGEGEQAGQPISPGAQMAQDDAVQGTEGGQSSGLNVSTDCEGNLHVANTCSTFCQTDEAIISPEAQESMCGNTPPCDDNPPPPPGGGASCCDNQPPNCDTNPPQGCETAQCTDNQDVSPTACGQQEEEPQCQSQTGQCESQCVGQPQPCEGEPGTQCAPGCEEGQQSTPGGEAENQLCESVCQEQQGPCAEPGCQPQCGQEATGECRATAGVPHPVPRDTVCSGTRGTTAVRTAVCRGAGLPASDFQLRGTSAVRGARVPRPLLAGGSRPMSGASGRGNAVPATVRSLV